MRAVRDAGPGRELAGSPAPGGRPERLSGAPALPFRARPELGGAAPEGPSGPRASARSGSGGACGACAAGRSGGAPAGHRDGAAARGAGLPRLRRRARAASAGLAPCAGHGLSGASPQACRPLSGLRADPAARGGRAGPLRLRAGAVRLSARAGGADGPRPVGAGLRRARAGAVPSARRTGLGGAGRGGAVPPLPRALRGADRPGRCRRGAAAPQRGRGGLRAGRRRGASVGLAPPLRCAHRGPAGRGAGGGRLGPGPAGSDLSRSARQRRDSPLTTPRSRPTPMVRYSGGWAGARGGGRPKRAGVTG